MKYQKGYPLIEFDSWNDMFFLCANPDSMGRIISKETALKLANKGKYYFRETGYRGDLGGTQGKLYTPSQSAKKIKEYQS